MFLFLNSQIHFIFDNHAILFISGLGVQSFLFVVSLRRRIQRSKVALTLSVHTRREGCRCLTSINTLSVQLQDSSYCLCAAKAHVSADVLGHFSVELTLPMSTARGQIIAEMFVCLCMCAQQHWDTLHMATFELL